MLANKKINIILFLALALRIYIAFGTGLPWITIDSMNYILQARALLYGDYLYYFPNGYPLIISFFIIISPLISFKTGLIIFNIVISVTGVFLIYRIAESYFGKESNYALIAALISAFYPQQLNYVRFILTEVPATFLLILSLYLYLKNKNILAGLSIGYAFAIKTTLMPIPFLFVLYLLIRRKLKTAFQFLIISVIPVSVFLIYGYLKTGSFTLFIDVPKLFYISLGLKEIPSDVVAGLNEYVKYLFGNPLGFIYDRLKSLWDMWGFLPAENEGLRSHIFFRLLIALRFPLLILALYGFVKSKKDGFVIYLILPFFVITVIHALLITSVNESFIANPRYIFPAEPFLILLALMGVREWRSEIRD